jgi:hypothetical protein
LPFAPPNLSIGREPRARFFECTFFYIYQQPAASNLSRT